MIGIQAAFVLSVSLWPQAQAPVLAAHLATGANSIERAFERIYNLDLPGSSAILDEHAREEPDDPLTPAVRAVTYLFTELQRLRILEMQFFLDDDNMVDGSATKSPDPAIRKRINECLADARRRAEARLAKTPHDVNALFAMCLVVNVELDYVALVERRTWRALHLARDATNYSAPLLALNPPFYDAYLAYGSMEYIVGSLPFFIRWFVHYDGIRGDKRRGVDQLKLVARQGRYYRPLARVLLTLVSLREGKPEEAEKLLADLVREFPENPVFKKELARVGAEVSRRKARRDD